jgi:hypothetical protein
VIVVEEVVLGVVSVLGGDAATERTVLVVAVAVSVSPPPGGGDAAAVLLGAVSLNNRCMAVVVADADADDSACVKMSVKMPSSANFRNVGEAFVVVKCVVKPRKTCSDTANRMRLVVKRKRKLPQKHRHCCGRRL